MIGTKKKKKARKGVRGCWGTVGWGKLIILNRVFRKGFTKKQRARGVKECALQITGQRALQVGGRANVKTSRGKRVWLTIGRV